MDASATRTTRNGRRRGGSGASAHAGGPLRTDAAADPVDRFFERFDNGRPNMSLDTSVRKAPEQAYRRRLPRPGVCVKRSPEMSGAYD